MTRPAPLYVVTLASLLLLASCVSKRTLVKHAPSDASLSSSEAGEERALGFGRTDVQEVDIRGKKFQDVQALRPVYFKYDEYDLTEETRDALGRNAAYLSEHPYLEILVEGHCDERGTSEYNLALGQRRAAAAREHYMRLGVPGRSIATLSLGEEKPACLDHSEACRQLNRRASSKARFKEDGLTLKDRSLSP
ncbi:MAG TPA: peptidoglycan-associated lipoprotein [Elusimicrobia bacterium]|nr:peptidoglycan-associated lipoprotein [Elusimicrobiota bacterium]